MAQVIIYSQSNGKVAVCMPTKELPIEEVLAKDTPLGSIIVDTNDLPNEHSNFFDAWELNGTTVTVNFNKAVSITKDRLRIEREPLLAAQDILYIRAIEQNQNTNAIVAEKQRLRDITILADQANTLNELRLLSA